MDCKDLFEAPISDFTHVGDWTKASSFRSEQDRKLLTNPKAIQKIKNQWNRVPVDFNMYFVNHADGMKHSELGTVEPEWLATNIPRIASDIEIKPNAINILYMDNRGVDRVPMTGWTMAHRFGHAIEASFSTNLDWRDAMQTLGNSMAYILRQGYDINAPENGYNWERWTYSGKINKLLCKFYNIIGTMRSARMGLLKRNFEFNYELFAQYLLTSRIKFNPLPKALGGYRFAGTERDYEYFNDALDDMADTMTDHFDNVLGRAVGKVFIM